MFAATKKYLEKDDLVARVAHLYLGVLLFAFGIVLFFYVFVESLFAKIAGNLFITYPVMFYGGWAASKIVSKSKVKIPFWNGEGIGSGIIIGEILCIWLPNILLIIAAVPVAWFLRKIGVRGNIDE